MTGSRLRNLEMLALAVLVSVSTVACADLFNNLFKPSSDSGSESSGSTTPPATGLRVTSVTAGVDTGAFTGSCPRKFTFTGTITASEPGTVTYKWERSDGTATPLETLIFAGSGSLTVVNAWDVNATIDAWSRVKVMSPNEVTSNQAKFVAVCQ